MADQGRKVLAQKAEHSQSKAKEARENGNRRHLFAHLLMTAESLAVLAPVEAHATLDTMMAEAVGMPAWLAKGEALRSRLFRRQSRWEDALAAAERCVQWIHEYSPRRNALLAQIGLAKHLIAAGRTETAHQRYLGVSDAAAESMPDVAIEACVVMAALLRLNSRHDEATEAACAAVGLARNNGSERVLAFALAGQAIGSLVGQTDLAQARALAEEAFSRALAAQLYSEAGRIRSLLEKKMRQI